MQICDPLYNRLMDLQICELIVQNRFPQMFKSDCSMASAFTNKFTTVDEFRGCFNFFNVIFNFYFVKGSMVKNYE